MADETIQSSEQINVKPIIIWIAVILTVGMMYIASALFIPLVIATLAYLSLRPIVARIGKFGLPRSIASGLLIFLLFGAIATIASVLYAPAQQWIAVAPQSIVKVQDRLAVIMKPLTILDRAEQTIDDASGRNLDRQSVEVSVQKPGFVDQSALISNTGQLVAFIAGIAVLTYFMLASGDDLLNRMLGALPDDAARHVALEKISAIQHSVGKYLAQMTAINIGLGVAVTLVMSAVGMPTPILWGVLATLFNFIPFLGPVLGTALVFMAAASTPNTIVHAFLMAFAFWAVTAVEGQFITPTILGKTLQVGPLVVLIAVAFWGFMWGLPGVFLAVPLLIVQRQLFAGFKHTHFLAVILGEDDCRPSVDRESIKVDQTIAETAWAEHLQ